MLWLKALHIVFVVTWFAGLFYLPRLFIYHADASDAPSRARFKIMQRRLLVMTHIGGVLAVALGLATLTWWLLNVPGWFAAAHWMHAKLALVALLIGYHVWLVRLTRAFARDEIPHGTRWLRIFNEVPGVLLLCIVVLAVVKPF